jgi:hypothetical protein
VERIQPGQTFAVPRTALLLTGMVRSLLPLPASFSLAVANPKRSTSAADLLWPSNISSTEAEGSYQDGSRHSGHSMAQHSSSGSFGDGSMTRQQSAPGHFAGQHSLSASQQQLQQQGCAEQGQVRVVLYGSSAAAPDAGHAGANGTSGSAGAAAPAAAGDDASLLAAPAELPPGEFACTVEAMVLQVGLKGLLM